MILLSGDGEKTIIACPHRVEYSMTESTKSGDIYKSNVEDRICEIIYTLVFEINLRIFLRESSSLDI